MQISSHIFSKYLEQLNFARDILIGKIILKIQNIHVLSIILNKSELLIYYLSSFFFFFFKNKYINLK